VANDDRVSELYLGEIWDPAQQQICRRRIHWLCSRAVGERVLDVGCSQGISSLILGREGHDVLGIDLEERSLEFAGSLLEREPERVRQRVTFQACDALQMPFADDSFDTAILGEMIEHLVSPEPVLAEVARVVVPGGRILISTPLGLHPYPDHKQTFYLTGFLDLVEPLFSVLELAFSDKTIHCSAENRPTEALGARSEDRLRAWSREAERELEIGEERTNASLSRMTSSQREARGATARAREAEQEQRAALEAERAELQRDLALQQQRADGLAETLEAGTASLEEIRGELAAAERARSDAVLARERARERVKALEHREKQERVAAETAPALRAELADAQLALARAVERADSLASTLEARSADLDAVREELRALRGEVAERVVRVAEERREREARREQDLSELASTREQAAQLRTQLDAAGAQVLELRQQIDEQRELRATAAHRVGALEGQLEGLTTRLAELGERERRAVFAAAESSTRLEAETLAAGEELVRVRSRLADAQERAQALEDELRRETQRLERVNTELEREQRYAVEVLQAQLAAERAAQSEARGALASERETLAQVEAERASAADGLAVERSRAETLSGELDALRARGLELESRAAEAEELEESVARLAGEVAHKSDYIARLQRLFKDEQEARSSVYQSLKRYTALADERGQRLLAVEGELGAIKSSISYRLAARVNRHLRAWKLRAPAPASTSPSPASKQEARPASTSPTRTVRDRGAGSVEVSRSRGSESLRVGAVLDEFSAACFAPECDLVTFRPDNWKQVLEADPVDFLLVESAWHGNDDAWQYRVASFQKNMGDELREMVAWCREKQIPTVFWNKEDPAHYDRFIHSAKLFDVIATTDEHCVGRYREEAGHDRVFALPFAAQPSIHNPVATSARSGQVCFAGTWYGNRFQQRREDVDALLKPALEYDLDIYDRMHGATGPGSEHYLFPEIYRGAIRGRLEYSEMLDAYRRYKVFLNVNSVKDSPTMFSRRVFELLACGTPVISTPSQGIEAVLGKDIVRIVASEEETRIALRELLESPETWARASARGLRSVMGAHSYAHRFDSICRSVGIERERVDREAFTVVSIGSGLEELTALADDLAAQTQKPRSLWWIDGRASARSQRWLSARLEGAGIELERVAREGLSRRLETLEGGAAVAFMTGRDAYCPEYLEDAALGLRFSGRALVGKAAHYALGGSGREPRLAGADLEHRIVSEVPSGSLCARSSALGAEQLDAVLGRALFSAPEATIYAQHRFNYLRASESARRPDPSVVSRIRVEPETR
jgi:spore maturation protein CgeB/SAM-dependent methyltransferase